MIILNTLLFWTLAIAWGFHAGRRGYPWPIFLLGLFTIITIQLVIA